MGQGAGQVESVRRFYDAVSAYLKGDREPLETAVRELCTREVVAVPSSALASGDTGPFRGPEAVLAQFAAIAERWPTFEIMPDEYVDVSPNAVALLGMVRARRGDGSGYAVEIGIVNRFENGLIVEIHAYQSKRRALEEAGGVELLASRRAQQQT